MKGYPLVVLVALRLTSAGLLLASIIGSSHVATAAPSCEQQVEKLINDSADEDVSQVATRMQGMPHECLISGLATALQGMYSGQAIGIVNELQLQDPRLATELIGVLYENPSDAGFSDLVDALTLQARAGGVMAQKIATVLTDKRFRKQGPPRETAAEVLGASGRGGYPYIELLGRLANDEQDESVREAAQNAVKALIDHALSKGDSIMIRPGSALSPSVKPGSRPTAPRAR